jgi:hypothetical protein
MALLETTQQDYYQGENHGNYQFVSLEDIINQFVIAYVGEGKIISKVKRTDVSFFAQRALAELSFDTFKSCKAQEIVVPSTLQMTLPHDYVDYTKISWIDSSGIKHPLYPTKHTSNPTSISQDSNGEYSVIISGWKDGLTTDTTNVTYSSTVAEDTTNNQVDFTSAVLFDKLNWSSVDPAPEVGKFYTLTYTISNVAYVDPASTAVPATIRPELHDEFGNKIYWPDQSQNGTYTQTIQMTANYGGGTIYQNRFWFQVSSAATNFTGSISNVTLVESNDLTVENGGLNSESTTWSNYKSITPSENQSDDYDDETYWAWNGERYGLEPSHAQVNGSFYIDCNKGKIHFSSNISGKTVVLDYISDTLGTEEEMKVHKFAEEAMYKWIAHAVLSTRMNTPEYLVQRFKKEKFAETRKAKLRLSNINLEEITQILRGKSKQIKH